jgi:hypothetical protein
MLDFFWFWQMLEAYGRCIAQGTFFTLVPNYMHLKYPIRRHMCIPSDGCAFTDLQLTKSKSAAQALLDKVRDDYLRPPCIHNTYGGHIPPNGDLVTGDGAKE